MTSCSTAGDSAALPETTASVWSRRRGRTAVRCTEREHVADEPSPAARGEDHNPRWRCATHAVCRPGWTWSPAVSGQAAPVDNRSGNGAWHRRSRTGGDTRR
jgi:hypothetical protein